MSKKHHFPKKNPIVSPVSADYLITDRLKLDNNRLRIEFRVERCLFCLKKPDSGFKQLSVFHQNKEAFLSFDQKSLVQIKFDEGFLILQIYAYFLMLLKLTYQKFQSRRRRLQSFASSGFGPDRVHRMNDPQSPVSYRTMEQSFW